MSVETADYKILTPERAGSAIALFGEIIKQGGYNIIITSAIAGAGHLRQADFIAQALAAGNILDLVDIRLTFDAGANQLYSKLQNSPLYTIFDKLLNHLPFLPVSIRQAEAVQRRWANECQADFLRQLTESTKYDNSKPIIVFSTHSACTATVVKLVKEGKLKDVILVEYVPDPWGKASLAAMSSTNQLDRNHFVIVHDRQTGLRYCSVRPNANKANVIPAGTLSSHEFLTDPSFLEPASGTAHIAVEFSGNQVPGYTQSIVDFIQANHSRIAQGEVRLTIHTMHHPQVKAAILSALKRCNLGNSPNIAIISSNDLTGAITSRRELITGKSSFGRVDAGFGKGEVPLEDRVMMLIAGIFGYGHENTDLLTGIAEGRAIDLRNTNPESWLDTVLLEIRDRREGKRKRPIQSMAVLAPLMAFVPEYYNNLQS